MVTEEMRQQKKERDELFILEVRILNDATPEETEASGWGKKGKLAWLAHVVARHRADLRKILGD